MPDFSQIGLARVNIPNPIGRGLGISGDADLRSASRALWQEIEAGRVPRSLFTDQQLDDLANGLRSPEGLTWHHDGLRLNADGTGSMLLLDRTAHRIFQHVGWTCLNYQNDPARANPEIWQFDQNGTSFEDCFTKVADNFDDLIEMLVSEDDLVRLGFG